jgi:hypothetical protein
MGPPPSFFVQIFQDVTAPLDAPQDEIGRLGWVNGIWVQVRSLFIVVTLPG